MNKITKITFSVLAILFGAFLVVFGGYDDSPGAQLIGLIVLIISIVGMIKSRNKNPD